MSRAVDQRVLRRSLRALDWVNFFLADVQAGLGPFLGIYLINKEGWNPASIGVVLTLGGAVGLLLNAPAGSLIDRSNHKRGLLIGAAALTAAGTFVVTLTPSIAVVTTAQLMTGVAAVVLAPVIGAIALGLVGPQAFAAKTGRMQAFNHAGNVVGSTVYGLAGYLVSLRAGFWIASISGLLVVIATLMIKSRLIDNSVARGLAPKDGGDDQPSGLSVLLRNRPLLMLAVVTMLWQLANGAMLPITGQKLAVGNTHDGALFQAALIIVAQAVMIPMAITVGRNADRWGRKPLFIAAFIVLPIRGLLFVLANDTASIIDPGPRRGRCGVAGHAVSDHGGRLDPRQWSIQRRPGRGHHDPGHRGGGIHHAGRRDHRRRRLQQRDGRSHRYRSARAGPVGRRSSRDLAPRCRP